MRIYAVYTGYSLTQFVIICYIIAKKKSLNRILIVLVGERPKGAIRKCLNS